MASYKNYESDNKKYTRNRSDYNPEFNKTVEMKSVEQVDIFNKNLDKWSDFISWSRWYPDLFFDLISPKTGGIKLDLDQRVFLRCLARFISVYGVFPRGWSKTFIAVLAMYHAAIFYPDIHISYTAQTRENSAKLLNEKHREIIKFYPLLSNEIYDSRFSKDNAEILFVSGGLITNLANHQSSKGARRHRLYIDESNLLNDELFQDVLEPIPSIPRRTIGKDPTINPYELHGQINFLTTSGFKGTCEHTRNIQMVDEMANLNGKIVLGASWELAVHYGRGETKSQLIAKKKSLSPVFFAQNYESKWVGATDNALVNISHILELRTIPKPEFKSDKDDETYIAMDVARSELDSASQSSIAVIKVKRNRRNKIIQLKLVNLINLPKGLNFTAQTIELKRIKKQYNAYRVIIDGNTMGSAIIDEALKEHIDPITGESLGCWDTINTDQQPEMRDAEEIIFDLKSQGINSDIIINFIDIVEGRKLALLEKKQDVGYEVHDKQYYERNLLPHVQTDKLIEEISNLKLKQLTNGRYGIERITRRLDKDRFSAVAYCAYYIMKFEDDYETDEKDNEIIDYLIIN